MAVPNTIVRTTHGLTIRSGGRVIGAIHSLAPQQSRGVKMIFECEVNSVGDPLEIVPQTMGTQSLRVARYDLYLSFMEQVFGSREIVNLTDQSRPFTIREQWRGPGLLGAFTSGLQGVGISTDVLSGLNLSGTGSAALSGALQATGAVASVRYEYVGCWFTDIGRQFDARGERIVSVDATIQYTTREKVSG